MQSSLNSLFIYFFCLIHVNELFTSFFSAGQEEYAALKDQYMLTGEGFFLAYSIVDAQSFVELKLLREQILKVKNSASVPMVMVGNKLDIAQKDPTKRQVS